MSSKDRVMRHREALKANALARVELVVPSEYAAELKAYGAKLMKRRSNAQLKVVRTKIEQAYARFGAMYLDNISVTPATATYGQAKVIADALIKRGDKDAFFFGRELKNMAIKNMAIKNTAIKNTAIKSRAIKSRAMKNSAAAEN